MKLEEANVQIATPKPTGYRICFYTQDGAFDMTPEKGEPPIKMRTEARDIARKLANAGRGYTDVVVMNDLTMLPVDGTVLNRKRLAFGK